MHQSLLRSNLQVHAQCCSSPVIIMHNCHFKSCQFEIPPTKGVSTFLISHSSVDGCSGYFTRWKILSEEANRQTPIICRGQEKAVAHFMIFATFLNLTYLLTYSFMFQKYVAYLSRDQSPRILRFFQRFSIKLLFYAHSNPSSAEGLLHHLKIDS